ncbi:MAG TPA: hypothetical protein VHF02_02705 [Luteimonas sp.]|nr:hypothetical protein [Luteimonas sp.]
MTFDTRCSSLVPLQSRGARTLIFLRIVLPVSTQPSASPAGFFQTLPPTSRSPT